MIKRTRLAFEDHFTQVPNAWLRDTRLSRRARGLLAELLSHREGWEVTIDNLVDSGPEGREAIRTAIGELEEHGYLVRIQRHSEAGKFAGVDYQLSDPHDQLRITGIGKPDIGKTDVGSPAGKKTKSLEDQLEEEHGARKRATSIPAKFEVNALMQAWAKGSYPEVDIEFETGKFRDHHTAKGSTFKDWNAAWRTWIRQADKYRQERNVPVQQKAGWW